MIMTFDNTTAATAFMNILITKKEARAEKKGRAKWKLVYTDGSPIDYVRVKHC